MTHSTTEVKAALMITHIIMLNIENTVYYICAQ